MLFMSPHGCIRLPPLTRWRNGSSGIGESRKRGGEMAKVVTHTGGGIINSMAAKEEAAAKKALSSNSSERGE